MELRPLLPEYQISGVKQENINLHWRTITYIALLAEIDPETVRILQSERPVTFYTECLAIRGNLHVNFDAHENDLIDETRDFLAVTQAVIYPLRSLSNMPKQRIPLLALNRHHILGYHVYQPKEE